MAQDHEALRARAVMIDILEETVQRLRLSGFAPVLEMADPDALVVLRLDTSAWALRQLAQLAVPYASGGGARGAGALVGEAKADAADGLPPLMGEVVPRAYPTAPFWTPELDARIVAMRAEGKTALQIAEAVGTTEDGVHTRFGRLKSRGVDLPRAAGVPNSPRADFTIRRDGAVFKKWTDAEDEIAIAGYADPLTSLDDLAASLGRTRTALNKRLTALRLAGRLSVRLAASAPRDDLSVDAVGDVLPVPVVPEQKSEPVSDAVVSAEVPEIEVEPAPDLVQAPAGEPAVGAAPAVQVKKSAAVGKSEDAARFVSQRGGNLTPALQRPVRCDAAPPKLFPGMTQGQKEAVIAAHLAQLLPDGVFDPELDLELCEAAFGGKQRLAVFVADLGIDHRQAVARFDAIVAPLRDPRVKGLPIEAAGLILPALRARVARARGAA